jgi:hypothetical protein
MGSSNMKGSVSSSAAIVVSNTAFDLNALDGVRGLGVNRSIEIEGVYRKRVAEGRVFSSLKNLASLVQHDLRGLVRITVHAQFWLLIMLLIAQVAIEADRSNRNRSLRYFAN